MFFYFIISYRVVKQVIKLYNSRMGIKVEIARTAGFCSGVRRAITMALNVARENNAACMLGDIVHNEEVIKQIMSAGIKKISRLACGKNRVLLIRAHGASRATYLRARKHGYAIVDATCPMVKEIHTIAARAERERYRVAIIGDRDHDEVRGIVGQLKKRPLIIDKTADLKKLSFKNTRDLAVVVQSTQNIENVREIVTLLSGRVRKLAFFDTICRPTREKQKEARQLARRNDAVIVLGSSKSANTLRLAQIARSINRRTYRVSAPRHIRRSWLKGAKTIGILAGASTPDAIIEETAHHLSQI